MFNIGISEMAVIAALALILIGPKQLPEVARAIGRLLNELKRSTSSFTDDLKRQVNVDQHINDFKNRVRLEEDEIKNTIHKVPANDKSEEKKS
jgi:sec-independent protein translocase protein TatB